MVNPKAPASDNWLVGGGEMAKLIKAKDWSTTPLGPIETWPQSLRTTVSLVQASNSPISLAWGEGHVQIYNDGYWPICGAKHPVAMGQDFRECWASAFPVIGEAYATAWSGRSAYLEKMRMFLDRYGFLEETWFTFSFSPITDESGGVGGLFHPVTEMTDQMLSERRTKALRDLASTAGKAKTTQEAFALSAQSLAEAELDLPFTLFYALDDDANMGRLVACTGMPAGTPLSPDVIDLRASGPHAWHLGEVARSGSALLIEDASQRLAGMHVGPYEELPRYAVVLPIAQPGSDLPAAVLVAGVSARLHLTDAYRSFFDLVAASVSAKLANARAHEEERKRTEALAEIDRAKTEFFSNVSHEFRTPLTLILGPLEDELAEQVQPLPEARRARIETAHRNSLRLLKLVNTLLDFSRIEAGRIQASYEPTDLAADTAELASVFRSAVEKAGLELTVDCPRLPEPIYVDREMWEKIVLNLLSNALKHTFQGRIEVALRATDDGVELRVSDTGVGIPEAELPRLFERFHRVKGAQARSHEGTGIGLALVQELARLHGGTAAVRSQLGHGTQFSVSIKRGSAHLPSDRIEAARDASSSRAARAAAFVEEALHWSPAEQHAETARANGAEPVARAHAGRRPRVLWADDNADMRDYVERLLTDSYEVHAVGNGRAALEAARAELPDLVLSDVMMPELDGFGLLRALRADARLRDVPVVLLSARAGEEASLEGLQAGADDYLVKPFSARELLARVRTHIQMARLRREWASELERANAELDAFSYSVSHDLRAPLRGIDGFSKALLTDYSGQLDEQGRHYLQRVRAATQRMSALIDDLLKLSRVNRAQLERSLVDISALAEEIVADLFRREPSRQIEIAIARGMSAHADKRLLAIVLENLLGNAWKFTGRTAHARIAFACEQRGDGQSFCVRDNGAGFDMQYAAKLFTPFARMHRESEFEGTGVGLATVARILARHGGGISAEAAVGAGATFRFTLGDNV